MVNIKISRFSRAKKNEPIKEVESINEPIKEVEPIKQIESESQTQLSNKIARQIEPIKEVEPTIPEPIKQIEETKNEINDSFDNIEDDNFLNDLNSSNYKPDEPPIKEVKKKDKPFDLSKIINKHNETKSQSSFNLDTNNLLQKIKKKSIQTKNDKPNDYDDSMFSQNGSEILGRDKRILLTKIRQYKSLFPDTFKSFKIKINANIQELQNYLEEMDSIVECDSVEQFLLDSILQCIKLIEGVSSYTKYDIQGLADLLKQNKQFHQLSKQLFIKYKVFNAIPAESQLLMLVATSAYICNSKNKRRGEMEAYLNTPVINIPN